MRYLISAFLLFSLLLLNSCKKNTPLADSNVWLPQELKTLFLFYPGTYWVFEELNTGFEDSIFVTKTVLDTVPILHPGSKEVIGQKERFVVTCISPFYGIEFEIASESPNFCYQLGPGAPCHFIAQRHIRNNAVSDRSLIYFFPEEVGKAWPTENNGISYETMLIDSIWPSFDLAGNTYSQVRSIQLSLDPTLQYRSSLRRVAPGVGIIQRKVDAMGWNWVVKRYNVVQ